MIRDLHADFCHFLRRLWHSRAQPDVDDRVHRALIGARFVGKLRCAFTFAQQKVEHVPRVQRRDERGVFSYHLKQRRVVALRVAALRRFGCGFLKIRDVVPRDLGQKRLQILIAAVECHARYARLAAECRHRDLLRVQGGDELRHPQHVLYVSKRQHPLQRHRAWRHQHRDRQFDGHAEHGGLRPREDRPRLCAQTRQSRADRRGGAVFGERRVLLRQRRDPARRRRLVRDVTEAVTKQEEKRKGRLGHLPYRGCPKVAFVSQFNMFLETV